MRPSAVINGPLLHFEDETRKHILYFRKMIGHREAFFTLDNNSRTTETTETTDCATTETIQNAKNIDFSKY